MAARILGMGDIVSLVEEAHARIDLEEAKRVAEKVKKGKGFDLEDFKQQIAQMKKMGGVASLIDKLPAEAPELVAPLPSSPLELEPQAQASDRGRMRARLALRNFMVDLLPKPVSGVRQQIL
jgi:hypothetical protein